MSMKVHTPDTPFKELSKLLSLRDNEAKLGLEHMQKVSCR